MRSDAGSDAAPTAARLRRAPTTTTSRPFGATDTGPTATCVDATALLDATTLRRAAATARPSPTVAAAATTVSVSTLSTSSSAYLF